MPKWTDSEKQRRAEVEAGNPVVANIRKGADAALVTWAKSHGKYVYIGRGRSGNGWGNPFTIGKDGDRDQVCHDHIKHFNGNEGLRARIAELKGKVLGCYCHPERCHGNYLAHIVNSKK